MASTRQKPTAAERSGAKLRLRHAYRTVYATPDGKLVLDDIMARGHLMADIAVPGDSHQTYYLAGERRMALHVAAMLTMSDIQAARLAQQANEDDHEQG